MEPRVHVARPRRVRSRRSAPRRHASTTRSASSSSKTRSTRGELRAIDDAIAPGEALRSRVPLRATRRPVQRRRASTRRPSRRISSCELGGAARVSVRIPPLAGIARDLSVPTFASTGSRPSTSSRTRPSPCCGTRTTATRSSNRRRTSRAGSPSPTRHPRTVASSSCPARTATARSRTGRHADRLRVLGRRERPRSRCRFAAGSIVVFTSLTPHFTGREHDRRRAQGLHRAVRARRRGRVPATARRIAGPGRAAGQRTAPVPGRARPANSFRRNRVTA